MEIQLNKDLINIINNQTIYDRGTILEKEANHEYEKFVSWFDSSYYNDSQREVINKRTKVFKEFLEKSYNELLNIASNHVSVMVAGPAKYNTAKYNKIMDRMITKQNEMKEKIDKFYTNTEKMTKEQIPVNEVIEKYRNGYSEPISSDDPNVKEKLQAKLEYLEKKHQEYKDFNKLARENKDPQLPAYVLANSNQNMKSIKDRLLQLDKVSSFNDVGYYFNAGEVRFDKQDNRVRIFFDEIPSSETRDTLKQNGFKWSPKNTAWQRQLTPQAISRTKYLFKDIGSLEIKQVNNNIDKEINI